MAQSGSFDHIAINRHDREVMWQHTERPIARRIVTVDDHLKAGVRGAS